MRAGGRDKRRDGPRPEEYLAVLKKDPVLYAAAEKTCGLYEGPAERTYAALFAPALTEFVLWVLRDAAENGIRRLYFLARDMYPMYLAAKALAGREGLDTGQDVRYLRVSRYALRMAEYGLPGSDPFDTLFGAGIGAGPSRMFGRAGLTEEETRTVLDEIRYGRDPDGPLNRREAARLKERVRRACEAGECGLPAAVARHAEGCAENALGYLKREGLADGTPYALVDSGWTGTLEKSLRRILASEDPDVKIRGYYFGLYGLPEERDGCGYKAFFFMPGGDTRRKADFSNCLYEAVHGEACGTVKGYRGAGAGYAPVTAEPGEDTAALRARQEENGRVLASFLAALTEDRAALAAKFAATERGTSAALAEGLYGKLMSRPTRWEAEHYGSLPFSDDPSDGGRGPLAAELSGREIRALRTRAKTKRMLGLSDGAPKESAWIEGSIVRRGEHVASELRHARAAKAVTHLRQAVRARRRNRKKRAARKTDGRHGTAGRTRKPGPGKRGNGGGKDAQTGCPRKRGDRKKHRGRMP